MFLLAGGIIGAAAALLFAPKPGSEFRHDIADVTKRGYDGALDLTTKVKDETSHFYQRLVEKGSDLLGSAPQSAATASGEVDEAVGLNNEGADLLSLNDQNESSSSQGGPTGSTF
jgi:gas vesicle protein